MTSPAVVSKRRAPYTSAACNNCRRRRCKCDGVHPTCGTCLFYGHECNWNQEEASQRPATKQLVQGLRMRIRELESEIMQLKIGPIYGSGQETHLEFDNGASPVDPGTNIDEIKEEFPRRSHLTMQEGNISASGPTSMWSTPLMEPEPLKEHETPQTGLIYRYTFQRNPSIPLLLESQDIQMSEQCEWDRYLPRFNPDVGFTRLEHDTLLYSCLNDHTLWLGTLERDLFLRDMLLELTSGIRGNADTAKTNRGLTYYSPFLHCALMSLATAFSNNPTVRSKRVREQFAKCAKRLLGSECERPTLIVIYGLVFLAEYHGGLGDRNLAYLYFGMGCTMVRALGLCINGEAMVQSKMITRQELTSRTWSFWTLFCQDKLMSFEYGRDYDVPLPHLDVGLPTVDPIRDQHPWEGIKPTEDQKVTNQPNQSTLVFFQGCRLMLIAIRIMNTVYAQGRQGPGMAGNDSITNIHRLLYNWYKDLPTQIRVLPQFENPPLPHVIVLNVTYWWLLILLHRPFSFSTQSSPSTPSWSASTVFTGSSADICEQAAKNIVQLVATFDQIYSCRYFPLNTLQTIFVAGATLLGRSATLPDTATGHRSDGYAMIQECIRTLNVAAQTWEVARLYASQLEAMLNEGALWPSLASYNDNPTHNVYESSAPDHDDTFSRMFRDFIVHHDQDSEELGIPLAAMQFPYPLLQQLNEQPPLGVSPGPERIMGPTAPLPPSLLPPSESEAAEEMKIPLDAEP